MKEEFLQSVTLSIVAMKELNKVLGMKGNLTALLIAFSWNLNSFMLLFLCIIQALLALSEAAGEGGLALWAYIL